ncbi:hypothetical protein TWF225_010357 [Orbilia oligospora]|nr:hypothetical protein TWF225_010357 [Orbilia oligospora]
MYKSHYDVELVELVDIGWKFTRDPAPSNGNCLRLAKTSACPVELSTCVCVSTMLLYPKTDEACLLHEGSCCMQGLN